MADNMDVPRPAPDYPGTPLSRTSLEYSAGMADNMDVPRPAPSCPSTALAKPLIDMPESPPELESELQPELERQEPEGVVPAQAEDEIENRVESLSPGHYGFGNLTDDQDYQDITYDPDYCYPPDEETYILTGGPAPASGW